jgi:ankyrin repeat protein
LLLALKNRDVAMSQRLLELGADPTLVIGGRIPLLEAIAWAPVELLDRLVGGRSKLPESLASPEGFMLATAINAVRPDGVDWLLAHGVSANQPDDQGVTPLHGVFGSSRDNRSPGNQSSMFKILDALLKANADGEALDAAFQGHVDRSMAMWIHVDRSCLWRKVGGRFQ